MPDVFGTQFADDARDNIVSLIEALKTTMASGYDPTFSFVYDNHHVAKLELNAISVSVLESPATFVSVDDGPGVEWNLRMSCRIHTAYEGDRFDERDTMRLAESVANKLESNLFAFKDDNYFIQRVESITNEQSFPESMTMGAELIVQMLVCVEYTQE